MKNSGALFYSRIYLRNRFGLQTKKTEAETIAFTEHFGLIAEILNENCAELEEVINGKTGTELLSLGFSVGQIQEYFEYKACEETNNQYRWVIKKDIVIDKKNIQNLYDLARILKINDTKRAC